MTGESQGVERDIDALEAAFSQLGLIWKSSIRDFAAAMHPELRPAGWHVIRQVLRGDERGEPLTVSEIIHATQMDKSVVSRQLRALKEWGLVELERSDADARVFVVKATDDSRRRFADVRAMQRRLYQRGVATWSPEDVAKFAELFTKFVTTAGA